MQETGVAGICRTTLGPVLFVPDAARMQPLTMRNWPLDDRPPPRPRLLLVQSRHRKKRRKKKKNMCKDNNNPIPTRRLDRARHYPFVNVAGPDRTLRRRTRPSRIRAKMRWIQI